MTAELKAQKQKLLLEPGGLRVPVGSRVAYLFERPDERARFARFIASGLKESDKCIIVTDEQGRDLFYKALGGLGLNPAEHERDGSLVLITNDISVESIEPVASLMLEDARSRFHAARCINDTTWMRERGWSLRDFLRFEVKGHLLTQHQPCTIICQYNTTVIERRRLEQIILAHQFIVSGSRIVRNSDRRHLGQIIFDSMDEQLHALTQLQDLSMKLTTSLGLDQTLDAIIEAAITICRADRAAISYINNAGELCLIRHRGLSEEFVKHRRVTCDEPLLAGMIMTKLPVIIEDIEEIAGLSGNYEAWKSEGIGSIVRLPLISDGKVFGVISTGSGKVHRFSQTEIDAMAILSAQASAAITNARLFEQLRKANEAKDEFLATLSHELRTPLTPVLGWMHILKPFAKADPLLAQGLETIERNASQQAGLINDLLDLSRIISGKLHLVVEPTNLNALVRSAVDHIRPQAEAGGLTVELGMPDEPLVCDADPVRLQQVVSNLLNNAVKFTNEGGRISVSLSEEHGEQEGGVAANGVIIEIVDTGIGIGPDFLPHVFERFAQAHGGLNRRYGGLGLGLAITRAIVEMHGGAVTASSPGLGYGSCFTVRLPRRAAHATQDHEGALEIATEEGDFEQLNLRVLVIEDSRDTLDMLKLWLDSHGCEVLLAIEGNEGLRLATEDPPDLIISDIGMPEIDGYELIRKVRSTPGLERVPAIALTGYAHEEDRELALAAGYNAHIAKPAEMGYLLHIVKKLTKK